MSKFKIGDKVVKVISVFGDEIGTYKYIVGDSIHKDYVKVADEKNGESYGHVDLHSYHRNSGICYEDNIYGCFSKLITIEEAIDSKIKMEE